MWGIQEKNKVQKVEPLTYHFPMSGIPVEGSYTYFPWHLGCDLESAKVTALQKAVSTYLPVPESSYSGDVMAEPSWFKCYNRQYGGGPPTLKTKGCKKGKSIRMNGTQARYRPEPQSAPATHTREKEPGWLLHTLTVISDNCEMSYLWTNPNLTGDVTFPLAIPITTLCYA